MNQLVVRSHRIERLEARISYEKKSILKHAADLSSQSLTDFIVNAAYEAAKCVIQEHELLRLSCKDSNVFIKAFLKPPAPSTRLLKAVKEYQKDVISK